MKPIRNNRTLTIRSRKTVAIILALTICSPFLAQDSFIGDEVALDQTFNPVVIPGNENGSESKEDKRHMPESLITWEYSRSDGALKIKKDYSLVQYTFDGMAFQREVLFTSPYTIPHVSDYKAEVYQDHFIINTAGDIFDLTTNEYIHTQIGNDVLMDKQDNKLLYRKNLVLDHEEDSLDQVRHGAIETEFYYFNLDTKQIENNLGRIYSSNNVFLGIGQINNAVFSPNKEQLAVFYPKADHENKWFIDDSKDSPCGSSRIYATPGTLRIVDVKTAKTVLLQEVLYDFGKTSFKKMPLHWVDNKTIVTHKKNGSLIRINTETKEVKDFNKISYIMSCDATPSFFQSASGTVYYRYSQKGNGIYAVDASSLKMKNVSKYDLDSDIKLGVMRDNPGHHVGYQYFLGDKLIIGHDAATNRNSFTKDYLAVLMLGDQHQFEPADAHSKIMVVDRMNNDKFEIDITHLKQMIGWFDHNGIMESAEVIEEKEN